MNPQFDPTPGLRLPQPSMNPGVMPQSAAPQQPMQPVASPEAQAIVGQQPQFPQQTTSQPAFNPAPQFVAPQPTANPMMPIQPAAVESAPAPQQVTQIIQQPMPPTGIEQPIPAVAPSPEDKEDDAQDEAWVSKAKATAEQYHADPYAQSKAFSRLKAEYLQARHNKTIKVSE